MLKVMFAIITSWSKYIKIGIMGINLLLIKTLRYTGALLVTRTHGLGLRDPKLDFFFCKLDHRF
jgi:hypothetical protein